MKDHSVAFSHLVEKIPKLDQREINRAGLTPADLYYLGQKNQVWGPYAQNILGHFLKKEAGELPSNLYFRNGQDKNWRACSTWHSALAPAAAGEYQLILRGHKVGQMNQAEIVALIKAGGIFLNDLISRDGQNWKKIFELEVFAPHFNRQELPGTPFGTDNRALAHMTSDAPPPLPLQAEPVDLMASFAFAKKVQNDPPVVEEQTGPFHHLSTLLGPEEAEGGPLSSWFSANWKEWISNNKKALLMYGTSGLVVLSLFFIFRSGQNDFEGMGEAPKTQREPASMAPAQSQDKGVTRHYPNAADDYAPNRELPVAATHEDDRGTTIIRYIPDTKKIDQALFRGRGPTRPKRAVEVGEHNDAAEPIEAHADEGISAETTEYETSRLEIEAAREAQERELEALKDQEMERAQQEEASAPEIEALSPDV